jgi:hypothetical protein
MAQFHQAAYNIIRQSIRAYERNDGNLSLCIPTAIEGLRRQYPHIFTGRDRATSLLNELGFISAVRNSLPDALYLRFPSIHYLILGPHRCDINQRIYEQEILPHIVNGNNLNFSMVVRQRYNTIVAAGVMTYLRRSGNYNF